MTLSGRMRGRLGMTVAIWTPPDSDPGAVTAMLGRALDDVELFIDPARVVLVVDGCPAAEAPTRWAAERVRERSGRTPQIEISPINEGQGGAVLRGLGILLQDPGIEYLCTRDMDGDHDVYDMPQLYRRLEELVAETQSDHAVVVGARADLHRPMGYARGQFEDVLNEVTVEALTAIGAPPDLSRCRVYGRCADFQSGYKMYTRWSAQEAALALREAQEREPDKMPLRWGVQFISTVELLRKGAVPAQVYRLTFDEQPMTTFEGLDDLPRAYGCQIAWLFRHLSLAQGVAWPILDSALCGTLFATTPGGWEVICALREYVSRATWGVDPPAPPGRGFMF